MIPSDKQYHPLSLLACYQATEYRTILVIGPYCWGRSDTGRKAYKEARKNLPSFVLERSRRDPSVNMEFHFLSAPAGTHVDGMGNICYLPDEGQPRYIGTYRARSWAKSQKGC